MTNASIVRKFTSCYSSLSSYQGDIFSSKDLVEWHRPRLQILVDSGVDLLAVETFPALVCC